MRATGVAASTARFAVGAAGAAYGKARQPLGHLRPAAVGASMLVARIGLLEKVADLVAGFTEIFK
jgi:hypothetical protein